MQNETVLERFREFKSMVVSSNMPSSILLDMIEKYITTDSDTPAVHSAILLDGQLSLFDHKSN